VYVRISEGVSDGSYQPGWDYFDSDSGGLGLFGFMEGQELTPGMADLPADVIDQVRTLMAQFNSGEKNRFDVFSGEIKDNKGNMIVPAGQKMEQADLDQFPPGAEGLECQFCMYWWADGVTAELPALGE
jgi:basic membrane protein A